MNRKTQNIKVEWLLKAMHQLQKTPELFDKNGRTGADILGFVPVIVRNIGVRIAELGLADVGRVSSLTPLGEMLLQRDPYLERIGSMWLLSRDIQMTDGTLGLPEIFARSEQWKRLQSTWQQNKVLSEEQMLISYRTEDQAGVELLCEGAELFSYRYYIEKGMRRIYHCRECKSAEYPDVLEQLCVSGKSAEYSGVLEQSDVTRQYAEYSDVSGTSSMQERAVVCMIRGEASPEQIQDILDQQKSAQVITVCRSDGCWMVVRAGKKAVPCGTISGLLKVIEEQCDERYPDTPVLPIETLMADTMPLTQRRIRMRVIDKLLGRKILSKRRTSYMEEELLFRCVTGAVRGTGKVCEGKNGSETSAMGRILTEIQKFIAAAEKRPQNLQTLYHILQNAPYGLPRGIIPVLLAAELMEQEHDGVLRVAVVEQVICGKTLDNADKEPEAYELYIENTCAQTKQYQDALGRLFDIDPNEMDRAGRFERTKLIADRIGAWYRQLPLYTWSMGSAGAYGKQTAAFCKVCHRKRDRFLSFLYQDIPDCLSAQNENECIQKLQEQKILLEQCYPALQEKLCRMTQQICGVESMEAVEDLAKRLMGVSTAYFQPESIDIFERKLQEYRKEKGTEHSEALLLEVIVREADKTDDCYRIYRESQEQTALLLAQQIRFLIREAGNALDQEEKAAVLIRMMQEVLKNDLP